MSEISYKNFVSSFHNKSPSEFCHDNVTENAEVSTAHSRCFLEFVRKFVFIIYNSSFYNNFSFLIATFFSLVSFRFSFSTTKIEVSHEMLQENCECEKCFEYFSEVEITTKTQSATSPINPTKFSSHHVFLLRPRGFDEKQTILKHHF